MLMKTFCDLNCLCMHFILFIDYLSFPFYSIQHLLLLFSSHYPKPQSFISLLSFTSVVITIMSQSEFHILTVQ